MRQQERIGHRPDFCISGILVDMDIRENVSLKKFNTLGVDSVARFFVEVIDVSQLQEVKEFAEEKNLGILVLGGGSNICFAEDVINKIVVKVNILGIEKEKDLVVVGAGEGWDTFVEKGIQLHIPYIENLSGIPGTVGASPIQNIGAYGVELEEILQYVEVYDQEEKRMRKISNAECQFGYRDSVFKKEEGKKYIVTNVAFRIDADAQVRIDYKDLQNYFEGTSPTKKQVREVVLSIRSGKFPDLKTYGTAGSFFKNPIISKKQFEEISTMYSTIPSYPVDEDHVKVPLAWILDNVCHLKGYKKGNVWLHDVQPLILVTNKQATAEEIFLFAEFIKQKVFDAIKIKIEKEVVFKK